MEDCKVLEYLGKGGSSTNTVQAYCNLGLDVRERSSEMKQKRVKGSGCIPG